MNIHMIRKNPPNITIMIGEYITNLLTCSNNPVIVELYCIGIMILSSYLTIDAFWTQPGENLNDFTFKLAWLSFLPLISLLVIFVRIITSTFYLNHELVLLSLTWFVLRLVLGASEDKLHIQISINETLFLLIQSIIPRFIVRNFKIERVFRIEYVLVGICIFVICLCASYVYPVRGMVYSQSILVTSVLIILTNPKWVLFSDAAVIRFCYVLLIIMTLTTDQANLAYDLIPTGIIAITLGFFVYIVQMTKYKFALNILLQTTLINSILYWYVGKLELVVFFSITNLLFILLTNIAARQKSPIKLTNSVLISMLAMSFCVLGDTYLFGKNTHFIYIIIVTLSILLSLIFRPSLSTIASKFGIIIISLAVFAVAFVDQNFQYEAYHQGFFLGPVLDLINGRSPLVNINAQYGVGILYGFSVLFGMSSDNVTFSYFSRMLGVVDLIYPLIFILILLPIVNNRILSALCVACGNLIYHSNPDSGLLPQMFPSTGAFRFAIGYLPIIAYLYISNRKTYITINSIIIVIFITWSLESALSLLISSIMIMFVTEYITGIKSWRPVVVTCLYICSGIFGWGLLSAVTYIRAGNYPELAHYLEFTALYGGGFGWVSPGLHAAWSLYGLLIAFALLFAIIMRSRFQSNHPIIPLKSQQMITVLVTISLISFAQGAYYVYRAHTSNLYHILWPSLVIGYILIDAMIYEKSSTQMSRYGAISFLLGFSIYSGHKTIDYVEQLPYTLLGKTIRLSGILIASDDLEYLMKEDKLYKSNYLLTDRDLELHEYFLSHQDTEKEIALFVSEESLLRSRLGTKINNKIASSFLPQDEIVPIGRNMMYESLKSLNNNENIVIALNSLKSPGLLPGLVIELCKNKTGIVTTISNHFAYVKIADIESGGAGICEQIWRYYNDN